MKKLALILCLVANVAFGQNANPNVGDVWSYFGPTLGAGWDTPVSSITPLTFGCTGDGITDDSGCLNTAATTTAAAGIELILPGQSFGVCNASFTPPNNFKMRGLSPSKSKIITLPGCVGAAATIQTLLPNNSVLLNPVPIMGRIQDVTFDGNGVSQYVISAANATKWAFPGVTVRNAKPSTVTTAVTNGTTAAGNNVLHFAAMASASVGAVVDDITRTGIIPPGATVSSCAPSCAAATTVTLSVNVTAWDDASGVANGDTIRFMTPTANVRLIGGYEYDFSQNFNIENVNDPGKTIYTSQTTLPMAGVYIPGASDSNFTGMIIKNAMYGVLDVNAFGNVFGPNTHFWGQGINNPTGQPFDLRLQYGFAIGSADKINDVDVDDAQIAAVYIASVSGINGGRTVDTSLNLTAIPVGGWGSAFGVLLGSNAQYQHIDGTRAFDLVFNGKAENVVYQRGVPHTNTIVRDNDNAIYTTTGKTLEGNALGVLGNQTTFFGPGGASATNGSLWVMPCTGQLTGMYVGTTGAPGVGNTYVLTVEDGGDTAITATMTGAGVFSTGVPYPPVNTQLSKVNVNVGDAISIKLVASAAAPTNNYRYRIYTNCQ